MATIESIGSSTRIEGAMLTDPEIKELIDNLQIQELESRDSQEVVGYYEVLELIFDNFQEISISENYIKQLHSILLKYSDKDSRHKGNYKVLSNKVVANYPDGNRKVIFNPTEPYLVSSEISRLVDWTNSQLTAKQIHPLLIIGLFVYEFLSIHPFQDGNGRLSRLLTTLMLLQQGYDFVQYVSIEHIIEERKKEYYRSLMNAQQHRYTDEEIISDWIIFFLQCIEKLVFKLEIKYEIFEKRGTHLNDRQQNILDYISEHQPTKIGEISNSLNQYSVNTIKKDLTYLINEKKIRKMGKKKGTVYFLFDS